MISRAMLRFATIQALRQHDYDPAPITLAGDAVFDSRLDDIEFDEQSVELPVITVYTEADERVGQSQGPTPVNELRHIDLQIEIAIGSFQKTGEDPEAPRKRYVLPTTDAELEFLLDCFEQQVMNALTHPLRKASLDWRRLVVSLDAWHSMPSRSADKNNRLAARIITLRCRVNPMCLQRVSTEPLGKPGPVPTIPAAPYLDAMIQRLAQDKETAGLIAILREQLGQGPQVYVPPFKRFGGVNDPVPGGQTALQAFIQSKLQAPPPLTAVSAEQVQFMDQYSDDPTPTSN